MSKISIIGNQINECTALLESNNLKDIEDFIDEMISVYGREITGFSSNLSSRNPMRYYTALTLEEAKKDVRKIRAMLENYRANLSGGYITSVNEKNVISINNSSSASSVNNINISIEQIVKSISNLPDNILSEDEKEKLEDAIRALELFANEGNKEKVDSRLKKIFDFALSKGPAVIALVSNAVTLLTDKILPLFGVR